MKSLRKVALLSILSLSFSLSPILANNSLRSSGVLLNSSEVNIDCPEKKEIKDVSALDSLTSDKIKELVEIPCELLPQAIKAKIEPVMRKLSLGFNECAMANYDKTALERYAKKNGYEFVTVDLDNYESPRNISLSKSNVNLVYVDSFRCDDRYNYREMMSRLQNVKYGLFLNQIPKCKNKYCQECAVRDSILRGFVEYNVVKDKSPYCADSSNNDYDKMVRYILDNIKQKLGIFGDFTEEQTTAICDFIGSSCRDYKEIERCFTRLLVDISKSKKCDFDSLLCSLVDSNKHRYSTVSMDYSDKLLKETAIHEVCHALLMRRFGFVMPSLHVFSDASGICWDYRYKTPDHVWKKQDYENDIMAFLAGRAGEEVLLGAPSHGGDHDLECAFDMARGALSLDNPDFYKWDIKVQDEACVNYLKDLYSKTKVLLSENRSLILKLADEIMNREEKYAQRYILGSEFNRLVDKFEKEIDDVREFQIKNEENLKNMLSKLASDKDLWNKAKLLFGIKSEEGSVVEDNKSETELASTENQLEKSNSVNPIEPTRCVLDENKKDNDINPSDDSI